MAKQQKPRSMAEAMGEMERDRDESWGDPLTDGDPRQVETHQEGPPADVESLVEALQLARETIAILKEERDRLLSAPKVYGRIIYAQNEVNPEVFEEEDLVAVIDKESPFFEKTARLVAIDKESGKAVCRLETVVGDNGDGGNKQETFSLGFNGSGAAQVKLLLKDDGTYAAVMIGDTPHEVAGVPGIEFCPGDKVKVNLQTKQIIDRSAIACSGVVTTVKNVLDETTLEVEVGGETKIVHRGVNPDPEKSQNGDGEEVEEERKIEEGDRVVLDGSSQIVIRHLPRDKDKSHTVEDLEVTWDDIGGLDEAKEEMREAIELPHQYPEIYAHYKKKPPKGVLLYGPPGCGKTLTGKATVHSIATIYGCDALESAFIYVKGPEILNMYVGNTEKNIRELFWRGRKHYEKHGYPAIIFIDEAEAVLSERGTGKSSDVDKTIVPMFLSEMDGLQDNGVMVMLATNRPKMLDPAVTREGRVDRHIYIPRPDKKACYRIFQIHMKGIPVDGMKPSELAKRATGDIFSVNRKLYQLNEQGSTDEHWFTFGDCITGSMIEGIVDQATSMALKRDIREKTKSGLRAEEMKAAIEKVWVSNQQRNHKFDLEDYKERNGLSESATHRRVKVVAAVGPEPKED